MDASPERKDAVSATRMPASIWGAPSMRARPAVAANIAGMLMRKEILKASLPGKSLSKRAVVVTPERESPGMALKP